MPEPASRTLRILIVEDEDMIGRILARVLGDHEVALYGSAHEALPALLTGPLPDVIISDLMMPGLPGWELFARLQAQRPEAAERLLFITGGTTMPEILSFLRTCGRPCLEKPFDLTTLRAVVLAIAQGQDVPYRLHG